MYQNGAYWIWYFSPQLIFIFLHALQESESDKQHFPKFLEAGRLFTALTYSFPNLEAVCCSMSSSNCCFLTCIQISHEASQVIWYFHLFKSFPQFAVIHTVKGFGIVHKAHSASMNHFCQGPKQALQVILPTSRLSPTVLFGQTKMENGDRTAIGRCRDAPSGTANTGFPVFQTD